MMDLKIGRRSIRVRSMIAKTKFMILKENFIVKNFKVIIACIHCKREYDLKNVSVNSNRKKPILCPHCGKIVGNKHLK